VSRRFHSFLLITALSVWNSLPGWAAGEPEQSKKEVIFHIWPPTARIDAQLTQTSGDGDPYQLLDGKGLPNQPLTLPASFSANGRDSFKLRLRDPNGNFKSEIKPFETDYFAPGKNIWPKDGTVFYLEPLTLTGYVQRYSLLLKLLASGGLFIGVFIWHRQKQLHKAKAEAQQHDLLARQARLEAEQKSALAKENALKAQREQEAAQKAQAEAAKHSKRAQEAELTALQHKQLAEETEKRLEESRGEDSFLGLELDGFKILSMLGAGGMGRVYRAEASGSSAKPAMPREVAVKFIELSANPEERLRTENESKIHLALNHPQIHPNIVQCYSGGLFKNYAYLIMELMEGGDLKNWLRPNGVPADKLIPAFRPIFSGVHEAHHRGIIHRDLKPENIMLTKDGKPKIADFGLAKQQSNQVTKTDRHFGSLYYISPEQLHSSRQAVPQSDQYSLGVILYQLLTGKFPFDKEVMLDQYLAIYNEPPPHLPQRPDLTLELDAAIQKMLAKLPGDRYPDLVSCYQALTNAIRPSV
jgi:hypothetical protein